MKFRRFFVLILVLNMLSTLGAYEAQQIWPFDAPVFSRIQQLYRVEGRTVPLVSAPWTSARLLALVSEFDEASLSDEGRSLFHTIMQDIDSVSRGTIMENVTFDYGAEYAFETYLHTNSNDFTRETDWDFGWVERLPVLRIPLTLSAFDRLYLETEVSVLQRLYALSGDAEWPYEASVWTNHSALPIPEFDANWPYRAIGVIGGKHWSVSMGRDRLNVGPGRTGNLLVSSHLPYHEHMRFSSWFGDALFETTFIGFPPPSVSNTQTVSANTNYNVHLYISHRIEFQMLKRIRIALNEAMMYQAETLDFRHLNPLMTYHNFYIPNNANSMGSIEAQVTIFPGFSLYGQFAIDEFKLPDEGASRPNAYGWQIGTEYGKVNKAGSFTTWLEYVHLSPMMYQREKIDFIVSYDSNGNYVWNYLGYPDGGDVVVLGGGVQWDSLRGATASLSVKHSLKGATPLWVTQYPPTDIFATTPTGIPESKLSINVSGSYDFSTGYFPIPFGPVVYANGSFIRIVNKDNNEAEAVFDMQFTLGIRVSI